VTSTEVFFRGPDVDEDGGSAAARAALRARGTELAVAGFVLSVLWLFFLGSIAGLCLGLTARRRLAAEQSDDQAPAPWVGKLAIAAVVIGGLGTAAAIALAALQAAGVVDITAACHPAVTGQTCSLILRR
jgi:hypothetical protein